MHVRILILAVVAACAAPLAPPPAPPTEALPEAKMPALREVGGPGALTLATGATLEVPAGFIARLEGDHTTLVDPDHALDVHLIEIGASDPAHAVAEGWKQSGGAPAGEPTQALDLPAKDGWDAIRVESYDEGADGRVAQALARKKGDRVWVSLLRGKPADLDKRAAQLRSFLGSLKVPGMQEVDLSSAEPRSIADRIAELDAFIAAGLDRSETPGLEIAVVEGGRVVHAQGFGVRELGKPTKVDADTLMMIGSVTKSLSTLMMATAVDDGRFDWHDKAAAVLPSFKLADEKLGRELEVQELVCACAGLPSKDMPLILEFEKKKPEDVLVELAGMKPTTGLRETFQYQNHMVAAGGYAAAHALFPKLPLGEAYDHAMQTRIFDPLEMKRSTLDLNRAVKDKNHATPHSTDLLGKHHVVSLDHERFATYIRPSGGIWSSANEMAQYLMDELAKGALPNGKRLVSEANLTKRWEHQVALSSDAYYGLGWIVAKTKGIRLVSHGGGTMGFATSIMFLPEKGLGVVMIANGTGGHPLESAIRAKLMELWFGIDEKSQAQLDVGLSAQNDALAKLRSKMSEPDDTMMAAVVGRHASDELGVVTIDKTKGGYFLDAGAYRTKLMRHDRQDGKQVLIFADPPLAGLELEPSTEAGGSLVLERAQERYLFRR